MYMRKTFFILILVCVLTSTNLQAAMNPLKQNLVISIDLTSKKLSATSTLTVPAKDDVVINATGLELKSITINGRETDSDRLTDSTLIFEKAEDDREVNIDYEITCDETNHRQCLINSSGAIMTGAWHPTFNRDAIFKLTATIPSYFEAVSEADEIQSKTTGDTKTIEFDFPHAVPAINFVAGPYQVEEEYFGNNQKLLSYFFAEDRHLAASYRKKRLKPTWRDTSTLSDRIHLNDSP